MKKLITVIRGNKLARFGGGFVALAVSSETPDVYNFGFKSDAVVSQVEVTFDIVQQTGSEGSITGYDYKYNVFVPVFDSSTSDDVAKAVEKFVMDEDFQCSLNIEYQAVKKSLESEMVANK